MDDEDALSRRSQPQENALDAACGALDEGDVDQDAGGAARAASDDDQGGEQAAHEEEDDSEVVGNVRVLVRVRPLLENELNAGNHAVSLLSLDTRENTLCLSEPVASASVSGAAGAAAETGPQQTTMRRFGFDAVLAPHHEQRDVYEAARVEQMVRMVLKGFQVCIFAYGATGSGKTHTMDGSHDDVHQEGVTPRCIRRLFEMVEKKRRDVESAGSEAKIKVRCSFYQIYQEKVFDLLAAALPRDSRAPNHMLRGGLKVRWSPKREFFVENLFVYECASPEDVMSHFASGIKKRIVASHKLNASSSRSHSIFTLYVDQVDPRFPRNTISSKLLLVDLAGSEKAKAVGGTERTQLMRQSIGINKSLFVLRKVIKALADQQHHTDRKKRGRGRKGGGRQRRSRRSSALQEAHIPFRDSTLTRLLKHSLGGNCLTLMIACLCPSDVFFEENMSTLNYAGLASRIANRAVVNEDPNVVMIKKLRAQVKSLKQQLLRAQRGFLSSGAVFGSSTALNLAGGGNDAAAGGADGAGNAGGAFSSALVRSISQGSYDYDADDSSAHAKKLQQLQDLEHSELAVKFLDSVNAIKILIEDNADLQEAVDEMDGEFEGLELENNILNEENASLRERVQFLQSILVEGKDVDESLIAPVSPMPPPSPTFSFSSSSFFGSTSPTASPSSASPRHRPAGSAVSGYVDDAGALRPPDSPYSGGSASHSASPGSEEQSRPSIMLDAHPVQSLAQERELRKLKRENEAMKQMVLDSQFELRQALEKLKRSAASSASPKVSSASSFTNQRRKKPRSATPTRNAYTSHGRPSSQAVGGGRRVYSPPDRMRRRKGDSSSSRPVTAMPLLGEHAHGTGAGKGRKKNSKKRQSKDRRKTTKNNPTGGEGGGGAPRPSSTASASGSDGPMLSMDQLRALLSSSPSPSPPGSPPVRPRPPASPNGRHSATVGRASRVNVLQVQVNDDDDDNDGDADGDGGGYGEVGGNAVGSPRTENAEMENDSHDRALERLHTLFRERASISRQRSYE